MQNQIQMLKNLVYQYPKTSIFISIFSVLTTILRLFHYKFIVYPQMGGRHNKQNAFGFRNPSQKKLEYEDINIQTDKKQILRGWHIKHQKPERLLIYFHQNAGNIGGRLFYISSFLKKSKTNILIVAYRGFSDSDGNQKPNQNEIMKDSIKIFQKGVKIALELRIPLFVFGRSLGGAAAIHTLSKPQNRFLAKGLIIQNTFTSIYDVGANFIPRFLYPLRFYLWLITSNSYCSIRKIGKIDVPILFIKGRKDELVPAKLMDQLQRESSKYKKRQNFCLEVANGTHNNTWYQVGDQYFEVFNKFMQDCTK